MAFKAVLVDDDQLVLQDLETLADWEKYGFAIAKSFTNGLAALKGIKEIRPDFIVTDIRMPIMDGLQFIEKVRLMLPETRILLLTAYSDFDYAKKAIELGVFNYLLKNELNKETLEEQLERVHLELMRSKDIKSAILQKAFRKFLYEPDKREFQDALFRELSRHFGQAAGFFYVIPMSASERERFSAAVCTALAEFRFAFTEEGQEIYTACEALGSQAAVVLFCMKRMPASRLESAGLLHMAAVELSACLQKRVPARVLYRRDGGILPDMQQAAGLLKALYEAAPYGIFAGGRREVEISELLDRRHESSWSREEEGRLEQWFSSQKPEEIKRGLPALRKEVEQNCCLKQAAAVTGAMGKAVKGYGKQGLCSAEDIREIQFLLEKFCDLGELFDGYERFLDRLESGGKESGYSARTMKVIRFIQQNYEKDISVGDAAGLLGLNSEYLNKVFKKETGESFSHYLTQVRMEKAKELLESGRYNVNQVSARTGYKSSQYFSITFRRYMGYSPSEAREHKGD